MATWSPRNFICRRASRACSPDSARTIRLRSPYRLRRSRATARDTLGSSSTETMTGRSSASPGGRVMPPWYVRDAFVTYRPAPERCHGPGRDAYLRVCPCPFAVGLLCRVLSLSTGGLLRDPAPHRRLARGILRMVRAPLRAADHAGLHEVEAVEECGHLGLAARLHALRHELVQPGRHAGHRRRLEVGGRGGEDQG